MRTLIIEFQYSWFWFSLKDYLFPVTKLDKVQYKKGKDKGYFQMMRFWQIFCFLLFPIPLIASFVDSIQIKRGFL